MTAVALDADGVARCSLILSNLRRDPGLDTGVPLAQVSLCLRFEINAVADPPKSKHAAYSSAL
jgi:hypothetical protein